MGALRVLALCQCIRSFSTAWHKWKVETPSYPRTLKRGKASWALSTQVTTGGPKFSAFKAKRDERQNYPLEPDKAIPRCNQSRKVNVKHLRKKSNMALPGDLQQEDLLDRAH